MRGVLTPVRSNGRELGWERVGVCDREVLHRSDRLLERRVMMAGEVEEAQEVAVADVEEEVAGAGVVAVLDQLGEREAEEVLVELDGPLDVAGDQRGVVDAAPVGRRSLRGRMVSGGAVNHAPAESGMSWPR